MTNPYPITRETREEAIFRGDGTASYGPFDLKIFDVLDVEVWTRADDAATWSEASPTVTKTSGLPFDTFSIAFPADIPATVRIKVQSKRVHERAAGVVNGTKIDPNALEKELSRQATTLQELRRDVDRGIQVQFGTGYVMSDDLEDGDTLMTSGGRIVKGANAADIAMAQEYAEEAENFAASAEESADAAALVLSNVQAELDSRAFAIASYHPVVAPNKIRVAGYATAGDGGAAVYKKVASQPSHAGKFSITLSDAVTVVWYELAEMPVSVRMFGATGDGVADDRPLCQAAIDYVVGLGGGDVVFPSGTYRLVGAANADGLANGLVIPFSSFVVDNRVRLIGAGKAILRAAASNMVVVRLCQPGSEVLGLHIDGGYDYTNPGGSLSGVWGVGLVPANRAQTATLVSQSFCRIENCHITRCIEGLVIEPGPKVGGSESGAFYPVILSNHFNLNRRSIWVKESNSSPGVALRPTRGSIAFNRIERGNCGIDLEYATEFSLLSNFFQFFTSTYAALPYAPACAIHVGANSANNWVVAGANEASDNAFFNEGTLPNALQILFFPIGSVSTGLGFNPLVQAHQSRITRRTADYEQLAHVFHHNAFARLVADYGAANVRDLSVEVNSVRRQVWGSSNSFYNNATHQFFLADGTTPTGIITSNRIAPGADNVQSGGLASQRYTQLFAATATVGTSDMREKDWRGGLNDCEMRVAKNLSKLIGIYRWIEAVEKKGDAARLHAGVTVQAVMKVFADEGLDPFAYGLICYDEWQDEFSEVLEEFEFVDEQTGEVSKGMRPLIGEDGKPVTRKTLEAGNRYGLRYDELWALIAAGFEARLTTLECS